MLFCIDLVEDVDCVLVVSQKDIDNAEILIDVFHFENENDRSCFVTNVFTEGR